MKLENIGGFATLEEFVEDKLSRFEKEEKTFRTLFRYLFEEEENTFLETSDGYRVKKVTYGAYRERILAHVAPLREALFHLERNAYVGLYHENSPDFLLWVWAILAAGFRPILLNTRLPEGVLEETLATYGVGAVLSDGKEFSVYTVKTSELSPSDEPPSLPDAFGEELLFLSSGTSEAVKLCAYSAEALGCQVASSARIITRSPAMAAHYKGELKQLVLLPLCHVFGFLAVYLWFCFFSRTLVFPKSLDPATVQNTVKKHGVTHIFAVPMVWDRVAKAARKRIRAKGERTLRRFERGAALINKTGTFGERLAPRLMHEVREGLFGESICFLISGGGAVSPETLSFFNGIGYHLANGYGMTEVGITSVELSQSAAVRNTASVGAPFFGVEYAVVDGELRVRGGSLATRVLQGGRELERDEDGFFPTGDLATLRGSLTFINGRRDDLIVGPDGENLNPTLLEKQLSGFGEEGLCLLPAEGGAQLLVSVSPLLDGEGIAALGTAAERALERAGLSRAVRRLFFTVEPLLREGEIKLNRRRLAKALADGTLSTFRPEEGERVADKLGGALEEKVAALFARALEREEKIPPFAHFFRDLGGTSLEYFALLSLVKEEFGATLPDGEMPATVRDFCHLIHNSQ